MKNFLTRAQDKCREKWSTFDVFGCILGLFLITFSIITLSNLISWLDNKQNNLLEFCIYLYKVTITTLIIYFLLILLFNNSFTSIAWFINFNINFFICIKLKFNFNFNQFETLIKNPEYFVYSLIYLIPFSNSFIIQENVALRFILISVISLEFYYNTFNIKTTKINFILKLVNFLLILIILRVGSLFFVCREEVLVYNCTQTLFATSLSKLSFGEARTGSTFYYLGFILLNFILILSIYLFVINSNNLNSRKLKISYLFQIIILPIYWALQLVQSLSNSSELGDNFFLKQCILYIARLFLIIFLFNIFLIVKEVLSITYKNRKIFIDLIINCMITLSLLISLVSGENSLSIWLLILSLDLYSKLRSNIKPANKSIDPILVMTLFQYYFFYATGHETIFTHIKWESAFQGIDGDNNNYLLRVVMGFFIVLNTFSSTFVISFGTLKYISYLDVNKYSIEENLDKSLANSVLKYFLLVLIKVILYFKIKS